MKSLYGKLSIALLGIVLLLGIAFFLVERTSSRLYYQELTQRLNAPIAMYIVGEQQLISGDVINGAALETLAHHAMVINPSVEVYLLDREGRILSHALPAESVMQTHVNLGPVRKLIAGTANMPLRGDDPRNPGVSKVFSAAEVRDGDALQGYLYVVLGGQRYDAIAEDIHGSYVSRLSLAAIAIMVVTAFAVGLLLFAALTRRLKRLTRGVEQFASSGFNPGGFTPLQDDGDDEIGRLGHAFNAMAKKISDQVEGLKENDRLRRELIANVSHDLRTPLASMQGYVDTLLIKNHTLTLAERAEYLAIARKHAHRLGTLVGDLFELARLDANTVQPVFEHFPLAELLNDVVQEFQLEAERRQIRIRFEADMAPVMVYADIQLIQRVLENLIKNALKFTPQGGHILIAVAPGPERIDVTVADTGRGIAKQDIPRIFDRFYRTENGEESRSSSSGLGLAIVKRILDLHGSRISVTSKPDAGTRFVFDLPVDRLAA